MNAKDAIRTVYQNADAVIGRYLSDLTDADLLVRPGPGQNHIAWQLGHLIASERMMVEMVKPGSSPPLPEGFEAAHGREETATGSDDASRFLTREQYLGLARAQREATLAVLDGLSDADLDAPAPERFRSMFPTVGAIMTLVGTHPLMHAGQFVGVRRKRGKPVVI